MFPVIICCSEKVVFTHSIFAFKPNDIIVLGKIGSNEMIVNGFYPPTVLTACKLVFPVWQIADVNWPVVG